MDNFKIRLRILSASVFCLYLKTHNYHLNTIGPSFYQIHLLLDNQWKFLIDSWDSLSEQIRALDMYAPATLHEFSTLSAVQDGKQNTEAYEMLRELLIDNERVLQLYTEVNDMATGHIGLQNLITTNAQEHEKMCFFLRSMIGKK
jgi:starvation-inducible DNA-binding protein